MFVKYFVTQSKFVEEGDEKDREERSGQDLRG